MANNRLYIEDTKNGDRFLVAKSSGCGWSWRKSTEEMQTWLEEENRDIEVAWNSEYTPSQLRLVTENEEY